MPTKSPPRRLAETALRLARERTIAFYGDAIPVAQVAEGEIYVPLRPLCAPLGLNWSGRLQRTKRDEVLGSTPGVCLCVTPPERCGCYTHAYSSRDLHNEDPLV